MDVLFYHPEFIGIRACGLTRESLRSGCGFSGTETALIEVACGLAARGHRVVVAGMSDRGYVTEGVEFVPLGELFAMGEFLAGVEVYCPLFFLDSGDHRRILGSLGRKAAVWVWLHCFVGDHLLREVRACGRRTLGSFMSDYMVPHYDGGLFDSSVVVGNAVDPSLVVPGVGDSERRGRWVFHACFERGGRVAERTHEYVRRRDPGAARGIERASYYTPDHGPGGSLSKSALASLLSRSDYFVYPLALEDGRIHHDAYPCSVLEAMAMGAVVVTWGVACMPGVFGDRVVLLEPHGGGYDRFARFARNPWMNSDSAVELLGEAVLGLERDPERKRGLRERGVSWARSQTWSSRVDAYEGWLLSSLRHSV